MKNQTTFHIKQKGAALLISMIMLFLLTILGITSMSSTVMEEKMAGNSKDREIAFQAAEAALRAGEREVEANDSIRTLVFYSNGVDDGDTAADNDGDTCTDGFCTPSYQDENYDVNDRKCTTSGHIPDRWMDCDSGSAAAGNNLDVWNTAGRHIVYPSADGFSGSGIASQEPKYIIEFISYIDPLDGSPTACAPAVTTFPGCVTDPQLYRITALGYGGTSAARVLLQSTYVKE